MSDNRALTPNDLARRYSIGIHKVLTWIAKGELRAVNVAADPRGRPQWSITAEDLAAFESRRLATPPLPKPQRRTKKRDASIIKFY